MHPAHFLRNFNDFFYFDMNYDIYSNGIHSSFRTSESAAAFRQPLALTRHSAAGELWNPNPISALVSLFTL